MSVYTVLTHDEAAAFLQGYGVAALHTLTPIKNGIENSNYFVALADGRRYVLTIFEALNAEQASFLAPLLVCLQRAGLPVAAPLAARLHAAHGGERALKNNEENTHWLRTLKNKPAQLAPCMPGAHLQQPTAAQCYAMGAAMAAMHAALSTHDLQRENSHGSAWWKNLAAQWQLELPARDAALLQNTLHRYEKTCAAFLHLPQGLIHGDLFRDNCLFDGNAVSAVLDFSEASHDFLLLDIAITVNDFCRQWPSDAPDDARQLAFISGYETRRTLTEDEKKALPVFLSVAAMRFWLSRLEVAKTNKTEGRASEWVLEKNPHEMRDLVRHWSEAVVLFL